MANSFLFCIPFYSHLMLLQEKLGIQVCHIIPQLMTYIYNFQEIIISYSIPAILGKTRYNFQFAQNPFPK